MCKYVDGRKYDLIRDVDTFYFLILEIYYCFGLNAMTDFIKRGKISLSRNQIEILRRFIRHHFLLIRSISNMTEDVLQSVKWGSLSGLYLDWIHRLLQLKKTMEFLEKDILLAYVKELTNEEDINQLNTYLNRIIIERLEDLRRDITSDEFLVELNERIRNLDYEQDDCASWILEQMDYDRDRTSFIIPELGTQSINCIYRYKFYYNIMNKDYINKVLKREANPLENPHIQKLQEGIKVIFDRNNINKILYIVLQDPDIDTVRIYSIDVEKLHKFLSKISQKIKNRESIDADMIVNMPVIRIVELLMPYKNKLHFLHEEEIFNIIGLLKVFSPSSK